MAETDTTLMKALGKVQAELKAPKNQRNTFGNYNYRSAEDILEAVKPLLHANHITMTISDTIVNHGDRYYVQATVTIRGHEAMFEVTGVAREAEDKKGMDAAQITGAASSYARKYALNGMFNIDDTADADTMDNKDTVNKTRKTGATADQEAKIRELAKELNYTDQVVEAKLATYKTEQDADNAIAKLNELVFSKDM